MEITALLNCLNDQRHHVLGILEGMDNEALRRPVLPSGWSCLGLVQHLALDVERFWFRAVIGGDPTIVESPNAWEVGEEVPAEAIFGLYRTEIDRAAAIIAASALDSPPARWPEELFGHWRLGTVREIILHVIVETACHAGHLDAVRELTDGKCWMVQS